MEWDVFISHASEDMETVAGPLSDLLKSYGLNVWLDKDQINLGDSLFQKINEGLFKSKFAVVILSPAFKAKEWTNRELEALHALEIGRANKILPVWHGVNDQTVAEYFPLAASKFAVSTNHGIVDVATAILKVVLPFRAKEIGFPLDNLYMEDRKFFEDLQIAFDRPAFKGPFLWQTNPIPFQKAYRITLQALTTGVLQNRAGMEIKSMAPITSLKDIKLFTMMQDVVVALKTTENLIVLLERTPLHERHMPGWEGYKIIKQIDIIRDDVIRKLNKIWGCFGFHMLPIPTEVKESTDVWESFGPE
jgi:TIR domain